MLLATFIKDTSMRDVELFKIDSNQVRELPGDALQVESL